MGLVSSTYMNMVAGERHGGTGMVAGEQHTLLTEPLGRCREGGRPCGRASGTLPCTGEDTAQAPPLPVPLEHGRCG